MRLKNLMIIMILIIATLATTKVEAATTQLKNYSAYQVKNANVYLNVRTGPGTSYPITKKYYNGEVLSVSEEIKGTDGLLWRKIRGNNEL